MENPYKDTKTEDLYRIMHGSGLSICEHDNVKRNLEMLLRCVTMEEQEESQAVIRKLDKKFTAYRKEMFSLMDKLFEVREDGLSYPNSNLLDYKSDLTEFMDSTNELLISYGYRMKGNLVVFVCTLQLLFSAIKHKCTYNEVHNALGFSKRQL